MELVINGYNITEPIENILYQLRRECDNYKLGDIYRKGQEVIVTCPVHKNGQETHPSCRVNANPDLDIEYGFWHCFTCGAAGPLWKMVSEVLELDEADSKEWLVNRYGVLGSYKSSILDAFDLTDLEANKAQIKDKSILKGFEPYHPYLAKRGIPEWLCERFNVKYDPETECVVFPVFDQYDNLSYLTRRNVNEKKFIIDKDADKSVIYLLNEVLKGGYRGCVAVESQFNALTLWKYGIPAIALMGSGTSDAQMETLNNAGLKFFILAYDNDAAGRKGANRFQKKIRKDIMVEDILMPADGRDVNDLTYDEIKNTFGVYFD